MKYNAPVVVGVTLLACLAAMVVWFRSVTAHTAWVEGDAQSFTTNVTILPAENCLEGTNSTTDELLVIINRQKDASWGVGFITGWRAAQSGKWQDEMNALMWHDAELERIREAMRTNWNGLRKP